MIMLKFNANQVIYCISSFSFHHTSEKGDREIADSDKSISKRTKRTWQLSFSVSDQHGKTIEV